MKRLNKILVKECVKFYLKAWAHRNKTLCNPDKHKQHVREWHKNIVTMINESNKPEMKKYVQMQKLDLNASTNVKIRQWNLQTMRMFKIVRTELLNDIRQYFRR